MHNPTTQEAISILHMPVLHNKFKDSQSYIVRPSLKKKQKSVTRVGEMMVRWLRALAALSEGLGCDSWHPHGDSPPSIIPVPGNLTGFLSGFHEHWTLVHMCTEILAGKTPYTQNKNKMMLSFSETF